MKVLIIEDELLVAVELDRIVEAAGHDIVALVASVDEALAHAARADVALVDLRLADGNSGGSLGRRLMDRFGIKVIFVTGNPNEVGYGVDGAIDIVAKPFTDSRILSALDKAEAFLQAKNGFRIVGHVWMPIKTKSVQFAGRGEFRLTTSRRDLHCSSRACPDPCASFPACRQPRSSGLAGS